MRLFVLLEKLLPRKFINTSGPQAANIRTHPAGCFKSSSYGPFLRSPDGRVIPLPKARFLKEKLDTDQG